MCRISGIYDPFYEHLERDALVMRDSMYRGGPDDAGLYIDRGLALGHRRLSIIDLSSNGHQPMIDSSFVLCFNGEIYNYQIIKSKLLQLGYEFQTLSDSEVILKSFQEWGYNCFEKFNGMFAIAIYNKKNQEIVLARDHAGIKPLYYYWEGGKLYFSSEIRALKALNIFDENLDWKIYFLAFGFLPEPITTLKKVTPLEKGSLLSINLKSGQVQKKKFSNFKFTSEIKLIDTAKKLIRTKLIDSVERHLISDAPIGLFLSGGIDSSLLTILSEPRLNNKLQTLSIDFSERSYSEKIFQDLIVKKTGAKHHRFVISKEDFLESLPDILDAMDQPTIDGINTYFICKYAKKIGLKAVISGIGADELFGGYDSFNKNKIVDLLYYVPNFVLNFFHFNSKDKFRKISYLKNKNITGDYLFYKGIHCINQISYILNEKKSKVSELIKNFKISEDSSNLKGFNKVSFIELNYYMQNQLLKDCDIMSMWHSIEVRVPFLDKELVKLLYKISPDLKFSRSQKKSLLINSFVNDLPREIYDRQKMGFTFPFAEWLKDFPIKSKIEKYSNAQFQQGNYTWARHWSILLLNQWNKKD